MECLNQTFKEKAPEKKFAKKKKQRKACIAWEENDTSSSSSTDKEEEANLYIMVWQDIKSSVSSNISFTHKNYSTLLNAFKKTHEEANHLALSNNNRLKDLNS